MPETVTRATAWVTDRIQATGPLVWIEKSQPVGVV